MLARFIFLHDAEPFQAGRVRIICLLPEESYAAVLRAAIGPWAYTVLSCLASAGNRPRAIPNTFLSLNLMEFMKVRTIIVIAAAAVGLTSIALADKYDDLVKKGYRWIASDGPFACHSRDDLQRIIKDQSDANKLEMVEELRAYFLVRGALVQVVQEDKASGMSQIQSSAIAGSFWTLSRFLSKRPIRDFIGNIQTPSDSTSVNISGTNDQLGARATPGATATPSASPTP
jgi:hypothetical protein